MATRFMILITLASFGLPPSWAADSGDSDKKVPMGVYVCRSPLLAFDFWNSVLHVSQELKIKLTHEIVAQLAENQNCIRIASENLKPVESGWGGALALADRDKSPFYFHNPDCLGWVHPDYYVQYVKSQRVRGTREDRTPSAQK